MNNMLNVVMYDAGYQKLASFFESGNTYLDRFLRDDLSLAEWYGKTYILLSDDGEAIAGYYNIGVGCVEQVINGERCRIGGAAHINCFALDKRYQGLLQATTPDGKKMNLSDFLLVDCIERILDIRKRIGFSFITLCSTKRGYNLYLRNDFEALDDDLTFSTEDPIANRTDISEGTCIPMYLPLDAE